MAYSPTTYLVQKLRINRTYLVIFLTDSPVNNMCWGPMYKFEKVSPAKLSNVFAVYIFLLYRRAKCNLDIPTNHDSSSRLK